MFTAPYPVVVFPPSLNALYIDFRIFGWSSRTVLLAMMLLRR
jgi:hypothetical protein